MPDRVRDAGVRVCVPEERGQHHDEERGRRRSGRGHLLGLWIRTQVRARKRSMTKLVLNFEKKRGKIVHILNFDIYLLIY